MLKVTFIERCRALGLDMSLPTKSKPEKVFLVDVFLEGKPAINNYVCFGTPTMDSIGAHIGDIYVADEKAIYEQINNHPTPSIDAKVLQQIAKRITNLQKKIKTT